jgi:hypothetical protein
MKMMVEVNVFVMPRHFNQFNDLTGSVIEYVSIEIYYSVTLRYYIVAALIFR